MATIGSWIYLGDGVSNPAQDIIDSVNATTEAFDELNATTSGGISVNGLEQIPPIVDEAAQNVEELNQKQQQFNRTVQQGSAQLEGMGNQITDMLGAYAGMRGLKQLVDISDTYTQTNARLNMINDGLQTTEELTDKIFASAQRSRASYTDMADSVAKLSMNAKAAFASNNETIAFAENLNKLFVIAGAEQQSIASATLQLTQALGSGVLRGEEFNAVLESAPNIIQTIADYMGVPIGEMRQLAADGQITASTVKNALLGATDTINAQFESMPMTWGQVWTQVTNELYYASMPLLEVINALAQNWEILEPIVIAGATALGIYTTALLINKAATAAHTISVAASAAAKMMTTGATFSATAAQYGFNAALLACPVTWIVGGILLAVAALYAVVAAINKVTGSSISATGIITGLVYSTLAYIYNRIAAFVNFFVNVWTDPVGAVARLFADLADNVLSMIELIAKGIDTVFGSNLQSTVAGWRSGLQNLVTSTFGEGVEVMAKMDTMEAFDSGYQFGQGIDEKIGNMFGGGLTDQYNLDDLLTNVGNDLGDIETNTADTADALEITNEDLKYLRDMAEQEVVNRFTTAEVRVEMGGVTNQVNNTMDLDGVVDYMATGVREALEAVAEGVHA